MAVACDHDGFDSRADLRYRDTFRASSQPEIHHPGNGNAPESLCPTMCDPDRAELVIYFILLCSGGLGR